MKKYFALLLLLGVILPAAGCGVQEGQRVEVSPEETAVHDAEVEAAEHARMTERGNL